MDHPVEITFVPRSEVSEEFFKQENRWDYVHKAVKALTDEDSLSLSLSKKNRGRLRSSLADMAKRGALPKVSMKTDKAGVTYIYLRTFKEVKNESDV